MAIVSSVNKSVGKFMNYTATKWFAKSLEKGLKEPAKYAATMMVTSIVTKDLVGCAIYTYQSYNNKKIPEEKRGFVAALDFINGIINVGGQILSFMFVERLIIPKLEGKFYTGVVKDPKTGTQNYKYSKAPLASDNIHKLTEDFIAEHQAELKKYGVDMSRTKQNIKTIGDDIVKRLGHNSPKGKDIATGFGIVVGALATMAFIKRTITPLISTPLAGWLNDKYLDKGKDKDKEQPTLDIMETQSGYKNNKIGDDKRPIISGFNSK